MPQAQDGIKTCSSCKVSKELTDFNKQPGRLDGLRSNCKACQAEYNQQRYQQNTEAILQHQQQRHATVEGRAKILVRSAKQRSQSKGLEFDLTWQFIVDLIESAPVCPLLGVPLILQVGTGKMEPDAPSLDRIDNSKGYVRSNVWIVSWRANQMKGEHSLEQLIEDSVKIAQRFSSY